MIVSSLQEYGIRCCVQLALYESKGHSTCSSLQISEAEGISQEYVAKIFHILKRKNLVTATRGSRGGYALSAGAQGTTLLDVVEALIEDGVYDLEKFCSGSSDEKTHEACELSSCCQLKPLWETLFSFQKHILGSLSLSEVTAGNFSEQIQQKMQAFQFGNFAPIKNENNKIHLKNIETMRI